MSIIKTNTEFQFIKFEEIKKDGVPHVKFQSKLTGEILGRLSKGTNLFKDLAIKNGIPESEFSKYFILKK